MNAKELTVAYAELVAQFNALEQRSSNFAARVSSHNACYRAEIKALREEVLALKAKPMVTKREVVSERISTAAWSEATAYLRGVPGETRRFFPVAEIEDVAKHLATVAAARVEEAEFAASLTEEDF